MEEEDEIFFDYMGHINESRYPLQYWKLKLRSTWIRENFYKLDLYKDPLYGLKEVKKYIQLCPFDDRILSYADTALVIAGGSALYMTGSTTDYDDVDLFSTNKDKSLKYFKEMTKDKYGKTCTNSYDIDDYLYEKGGVQGAFKGCVKISLIRREYTSPSEIVHGFDIDCCQFVLVDDTLYGTDIGIYSITNMCMYPDMRWNSYTYIRRLAKYHSRGIRLLLPLLELSYLNLKHIQLLRRIHGVRTNRIETIDTASILIYISLGITYSILIRAMTGQKEDDLYRYDHILSCTINWDLPWIEKPLPSMFRYHYQSLPRISSYI